MVHVPPNAHVQQAAKQVLTELPQVISADSTEHSIALFAARRLAELGFPDTWYHQCPALVLLGDRSCLSISGKEYKPDNTVTVGQHNLVTVDLSPCQGSLWGDCARSYVVEDGAVVDLPQDPEFRLGQEAVLTLHQRIRNQVTADFTFHDLFTLANDLIRSAGLENLDFLGNVGHSIATRLDERLFVEANNRQLLTNVSCFTFEPHIRQIGGRWGFKHENIYYFDDTGRLAEL